MMAKGRVNQSDAGFIESIEKWAAESGLSEDVFLVRLLDDLRAKT